MRKARFRGRDEDRGNRGPGSNPGLEPKIPGSAYAPILFPHVLSINALGMIVAWHLPGRNSEIRGSTKIRLVQTGGN